MLRIDVVTIFPRMLAGPARGRDRPARERGGPRRRIGVHDLREYTDDRHRTVDDAPFGGGPGMVMKAEPFLRAVETLTAAAAGAARGRSCCSRRAGVRFDQAHGRAPTPASTTSCCSAAATRGSTSGCAETLGAEEVSLGDFVLTGGEVAALAVIEATVRLLPGALGDEGSAEADSFSDGLLDFPHYTRPADVRGRRGARRAALRRPRADPPLAPQGGAARHARAAPRPAGAAAPDARRTRRCCTSSRTRRRRRRSLTTPPSQK